VTAAAAVAAACAAVGLGIWAASLHRSLSDERSARAHDQRVLAVVSDPEAKRVPLSGEHGTLVVARTGAGALLVSGVEPAARNKTYEAWVIVGRKPRPAGLFRGPASVALGDVPDGATVAVTLEKRGGARTPTGALLFSAKTA
jgi:anti-sigma-K factor RskA